MLPKLRGLLSVIISARDEARTLPGLLEQVELLEPHGDHRGAERLQ